jgi:hypothetical protein
VPVLPVVPQPALPTGSDSTRRVSQDFSAFPASHDLPSVPVPPVPPVPVVVPKLPVIPAVNVPQTVVNAPIYVSKSAADVRALNAELVAVQNETSATLDAISDLQTQIETQQAALHDVVLASKQLDMIAEQHQAAADALDLEIGSLRVRLGQTCSFMCSRVMCGLCRVRLEPREIG